MENPYIPEEYKKIWDDPVHAFAESDSAEDVECAAAANIMLKLLREK
jgi:hypothetical protein